MGTDSEENRACSGAGSEISDNVDKIQHREKVTSKPRLEALNTPEAKQRLEAKACLECQGHTSRYCHCGYSERLGLVIQVLSGLGTTDNRSRLRTHFGPLLLFLS